MSLALSDTLYLALACYALGTLAALLSLFVREKRLQHAGLILMIAGFVAHTVCHVAAGKWREVHPVMYVLSVLSVWILVM